MNFAAIPWSEIDGVVLDAVGTVIEPWPPVAEAYAAAAARQGVAVDPIDVKRRFHAYFRVDEVDDQRGRMETDEEIEAARWRRIVGSVLPDLPDPDLAYAELWAHFAGPAAWRTFPDVGTALARFREAGIALAIGSNFDGRLRGVARGLPELAGLVDSLLISSEVGFRKPHASFYRAACDRLGLPPERIVFAGDDVENDVRGPERAGLRGVLIDRERRRPAGVESLLDLEALVEQAGRSRR